MISFWRARFRRFTGSLWPPGGGCLCLEQRMKLQCRQSHVKKGHDDDSATWALDAWRKQLLDSPPPRSLSVSPRRWFWSAAGVERCTERRRRRKVAREVPEHIAPCETDPPFRVKKEKATNKQPLDHFCLFSLLLLHRLSLRGVNSTRDKGSPLRNGDRKLNSLVLTQGYAGHSAKGIRLFDSFS